MDMDDRSVPPLPLAHIQEAYRRTDPYEGGTPVPTIEAALIMFGLICGGIIGIGLMILAGEFVRWITQ